MDKLDKDQEVIIFSVIKPSFLLCALLFVFFQYEYDNVTSACNVIVFGAKTNDLSDMLYHFAFRLFCVFFSTSKTCKGTLKKDVMKMLNVFPFLMMSKIRFSYLRYQNKTKCLCCSKQVFVRDWMVGLMQYIHTYSNRSLFGIVLMKYLYFCSICPSFLSLLEVTLPIKG